MMIQSRYLFLSLAFLALIESSFGFINRQPILMTNKIHRESRCTDTSEWTRNRVLAAKSIASGDGKKKRRRRKKKFLQIDTVEAEATAAAAGSGAATNAVKNSDPDDTDATAIKDVAKFSFGGSEDTASINDANASSGKVKKSDTPSAEEFSVEKQDGSIPLPDIKDILKRKDRESNKDRAKEPLESLKKIDRRDKAALMKLLEQDPYADADDSFFEEQEYTTVSALLGERAKPFLGIPIGPLQVGHFTGALVIVLMAFIEYPGFPLTNLPSPIRGALQGGLGTVYGVNLILALFAIVKAGERGQPPLLWIVKVFTVGGLAFDQLTQLPTLDDIKAAQSQKGKRSLKNKRKYS